MEPEEGSKTARTAKRAWHSMFALGDWLDRAVNKFNNLTETNYELAMQMAREGRIDDAILRFRITLWIAPDHEPSMYNLACLYQHKGEKQKALLLLRRIAKRNPQHANAIYRIATLDPSLLKPELRPTTVPTPQLVEYFDALAPGYDQERAQEMYRLPAVLHQLLYPSLTSGIARNDMLDIGCGTGLVGVQFAETFSNVVGIDLSQRMLDNAYRRIDRRGVKIYNQLLRQDIRYYLAQPDTPLYDVMIALSVLPYLGDLTQLTESVAAKLRPGGMVALSFDPYPDKQGYGVLPATGYFGHTLSYVTQMMHAQGLETVRTGEVEATARRYVQLCFFRKSDAQAS